MIFSKRFTIGMVLGCLAGAALVTSVNTAEPQPAKKPGTVDEANIMYVDAHLALAKADLQKALDANALFANTYPQAAVVYLQRTVEIAQKRSEIVHNPSASRYDAYVALTEGVVHIANDDYQKAQAANQRRPNAVAAPEVERLRLTAEVARLRWERAKLSADQPELTILHWHLQDLTDEVLRLRGRLEMINRRD
jgi:hypothetical protein